MLAMAFNHSSNSTSVGVIELAIINCQYLHQTFINIPNRSVDAHPLEKFSALRQLNPRSTEQSPV
jgi:hypothetical protein